MGTSNGISDSGLIVGAAGTAVATTFAAWAAIAAGANVVPVLGQAAAGIIAVGIAMAKLAQGCGPTCTQASEFANQAEQLGARNHREYFAIPEHLRTLDIQKQAMYNFERIAQALSQACGQASLGAAGQRCIQERLIEGGMAPWCPTPDKRGCDWITTMYNPIKNDPVPAANAARGIRGNPTLTVPQQVGAAIQGGGSFGEVISTPIMIGGQAVSMGVIMLVLAAIFLIFIASV